VPGYIRKRGKHSWQVMVRAGRDPVSGKYVRIARTVRGTRKDAERVLARLLHEATHGALVDPGRTTTGEWLDRWLHDVAKPNVAAKTWERYEEIVRLHLKPHLGNIPLHRLRPAHVQRLYAALQEAGKHPKTILHVHRTLHAALEAAVRLEVVVRNVCDAVRPPRVPPSERRALTEGELARVIRAAEGTRLHVPVLLAALCGLRRGEVLGLRWEDVDLERGVLVVRRSLEMASGKLGLKETKTGRARGIEVPPMVLAALRNHRKEQLEARLRLGSEWQDHDLVCYAETGGPWWPNNFERAFRSLVRRCGIGHFTFHDLRHTHASQAIRLGADIRTLAARLGHSTPTLTLNVYGHEMPGAQRELSLRVDRMIREALRRVREETP